MHTRILESMEDTQEMNANDLAKKTSILDALHLLTMSWDSVSLNTIKNCFQNGGFSKESQELEEL